MGNEQVALTFSASYLRRKRILIVDLSGLRGRIAYCGDFGSSRDGGNALNAPGFEYHVPEFRPRILEFRVRSGIRRTTSEVVHY